MAIGTGGSSSLGVIFVRGGGIGGRGGAHVGRGGEGASPSSSSCCCCCCRGGRRALAALFAANREGKSRQLGTLRWRGREGGGRRTTGLRGLFSCVWRASTSSGRERGSGRGDSRGAGSVMGRDMRKKARVSGGDQEPRRSRLARATGHSSPHLASASSRSRFS